LVFLNKRKIKNLSGVDFLIGFLLYSVVSRWKLVRYRDGLKIPSEEKS